MQKPQAVDLGLRCFRGARGGGLEPPMTGPEPVVLPITPPPKGGQLYPSRSRALRRRSSVASRPRTTNDSNSGGPTSLPVIATRIGNWVFFLFRPRASPTRQVA